MRKYRAQIMRFVLMTMALGFVAHELEADVSKDEIKALAKLGMSEQFLLKYLHANAPVFPLSKKDLEDLRWAGVGEPVLALLGKGVKEERHLGLPPPAPGRKGVPFFVPSIAQLLVFTYLPGYLAWGESRPWGYGQRYVPFDRSLDPWTGYSFPDYGFSYYPTLRYYAPSYSYIPGSSGFHYGSPR